MSKDYTAMKGKFFMSAQPDNKFNLSFEAYEDYENKGQAIKDVKTPQQVFSDISEHFKQHGVNVELNDLMRYVSCAGETLYIFMSGQNADEQKLDAAVQSFGEEVVVTNEIVLG